MGKALGITIVVALFACSITASAAPIFQDNFEGGVYAGSGGQWTAADSNYLMSWSTEQSVSPTHSVKTTVGTARIYHNFGQEVTCPMYSFYLYDSTMTRDYGELRAYSGSGYNDGTLQQLLAIGKYTAVTLPGEVYDGSYYQGRVTYGSNAGWFNLNAPGAPTRSPGWHKFTIAVQPDQTTVNFFVDDILSRTITGATAATYDCVTLGFGAGTSMGVSYYDNVNVTPEPCTCLFMALASLAVVRRRR